MERITLNVVPKGITPVCHASQYDKGRVICLDIMDGLQGYILQGTETLELRVRKPDNNVVTAAVENTSSTYVYIVTTEQMTACEGVNLCELRITDGDDVLLGTLNFNMKVEADPLKDGIESETEIYNLETQIRDIDEEIVPDIVAEEVASQYDSSNVIFDDHPTAGHGTGYVVKSENVPSELNDLDDVAISGQAQGEALVWDSVNNKWVNGTVSTVGGLNDLDDVTIDDESLEQGQELVYNGTEEVFENKTTRVELTQAEYDALANPLPDVDYYITDAPSMQGTSADLSYDGGTESVYDVVGNHSELTTTADNLVGAVNEVNKHLTYDVIHNFSLNNDTWNATVDGTLIVTATASTTTASYVYLNGLSRTLGSIVCPNGAGGYNYGFSVPCIKGQQYKLLMGGFASATVLVVYGTTN